MASPKLYAQVWRRPGHATFQKQIEDPGPITCSGTAPVNGVGEGRITLPKSYDRFDEILKPDVATPANAVSSLVRVFSELSATPIFEFLPKVFAGEQDKADPDIEISGPSIEAILGYAKVEAWDWTGIDDEKSKWPDWIWGGRNILGDLESAYKPAITRIYTTATSGTFTIGVSFNGGAIQNTAAIAFNASAATVDTELTALSNVTTIEVSGAGTVANPWRIETETPEGEYVFSTNSAGLVGGLALQERESIGQILPAGWTTSFNPVNNISHGQVNQFRASFYVAPDPAAPACDTTGVAIMFDGDAGFFPGIQKIVPVKPGGRYYASATAYAQGATGTYRFVIRDLFENPIAAEPNFDSGTTISANTWTVFDNLTSVVIPDDVDRVIVRFAAVDGSNPPPTFVACLELREGMPPTTWGDIWTQLWLDASTDHAGRRVWQIGATATDFLTLDFTAAVDSAGAAWADPQVRITLKRGQSYLRVRGEDAKMGYEGRIVPNNVTTGTWKFQLYNPGTMGTDHSLISTGPSIQGGRDPTRRDLRRFLPPATDVAVEAGGQNIARSRNASAVTALGRIEQYIPNQDLGTLVEAATVADQSITTNLQRSQSLSYVLTPTTLDPEPFIAYKQADTVYVLDPPDIPLRTARRIKSLGFTFTKDRVEYPIQLESDSYVGVGAVLASSVDFLMKEFKAIRERPDETTDPLNYFQTGKGGAPTIVVAANDSSIYSKAKADPGFQCSGVNDHITILAACNALGTGGGRIVLCEGNYNVACVGGAAAITVPAGVTIFGLGRERCGFVVQSYSGAGAAPILRFSANFYCRDVGFFNNVSTDVIAIQVTGGGGDITGCGFDVDGKAMDFFGGEVNVLIADNLIAGTDLVQPLIDIEGGQRFHIRNNLFFSGLHALRVENASGEIIFANNYVDESSEENLKFAPGAGSYCAEAVTIIGNQLLQAGTGGVFSAIKIDTTRGVTESGLSFHIIGNIIEFPISRGIELVSANLVRIVGNYIEESGRHGISLNASSDCMIHNNYIWQPSQTTDITYDGIFLEGDSNDNSIQANQFIKKAATFRTRYCVNVSAAACDRTVIVSNQMRNGYQTAAINDAGTGTITLYPAAAAPLGDNFG